MDDHGQNYLVHEFVEYRTGRRPGDLIPGLKRLALDDGGAVNYKAPGVFEVVRTGVVIKAV